MNRPGLVGSLQSCFKGIQRGISRIDLLGSKIGQIFEVVKYSSLGFLKNSKCTFQRGSWIFVISFEIYVLVSSISSHSERTRLTLVSKMVNILKDIAIKY